MFTKIRNIPIFYGISHDQVSEFIERSAMMLHTYKAGTQLYHALEECNNIDIVIDGQLSLRSKRQDDNIVLEQTLGFGFALGLDLIFGFMRRYPYSVTAAEDVTVIKISKSDFTRLISENKVIELNYLNYLSLKGHVPLITLLASRDSNLATRLASAISIATYKGATDISLKITFPRLCNMLGINPRQMVFELNELKYHKIIETREEGMINIRNREDFLHGLKEIYDNRDIK